MTAFFSDLDHTLLYSHRVEIAEEKTVVEYLHGREQSYMTRRTLDWLREAASWLRLIPVTTRSPEQYGRIFIFRDLLPCRYALVCNGGVLLKDGCPDGPWLAETRRRAGRELEEAERAAGLLGRMVTAEHIHTPLHLMTYAKIGNPEAAAQLLRSGLDGALVTVRYDRTKVYCIPRSIHKGAALTRFQEQFRTGTAIAAGDSEFDVTMLNAADFAVVPQRLAADVCCTHKIVIPDGQLFSDGICSALEEIRTKQKYVREKSQKDEL
ncbi:MAG: HAD family hydrolase [Oscillospiraceae bacterium]|nr:HAD family hydrolase [Oscillospiraceae bacterium]